MNFNYNKLNNRFVINFFFLIVLLFFFIVFKKSFFQVIGDSWAYNELFINYEYGVVRRGLVGNIFIKFYNFFNIKPLIFFSSLFLILYFANIYLFYKIIEKWQKSLVISAIIIFSPALLLFPVYDENVYFTRDIFIKLSVLLHAYISSQIIQKKIIKINYLNFLRFILIPTLFILIFVHELQIVFLSVHLLITYTVLQYQNIKNKLFYFSYYLIIPIPLIYLIYISGNIDQFNQLNEFLINNFNIHIHPQTGKSFVYNLGNFYKWHFYYFEYEDFINTFLSFIFSFYLIFLIFEYLIKIKIIEISTNLKKKYIFFFIPCMFSFLLTDHGRTISFFANHLIAFYMILNVDQKKLENYLSGIKKFFFIKQFIIIFCFFYIFLWGLTQSAGLGVRAKKTSVFQSPISSKIIYLTNSSYFFLKREIFKDWPDIRKNL
jgi:hypothetical protein